MKVYLVRHGKTEWNRDKKFQGRKNSPLLEEGKEQARLLGQRLAGKTFAGYYCSPLPRTCETASLVVPGRDFTREEAFAEIHLGILEGEGYGHIRPEIKPIVDQFWYSPQSFDKSLTGGEDFEDIRHRSVNRLEELVKQYSEKDEILIVSHGALLKSVINHYEEKPVKDFWEPPFLQPASLTVISFEKGRFKEIETRGDTSHYA
ncbi:MAG: histidine phosphatase family protein [Spirochaetales bacterium]|nr:histidine phosphatase family protein [Spirochaetales bacterium]